jgi:hypothetical protein
MMILDDRYKIIKPKFDDGKIRHFSDILKIVPKTRLARDIGKSGEKMNKLIARIDTIKVSELAAIGRRCGLSLPEMLSIVEPDCVMPRPKIKDDRYVNINVLFRAGEIGSLADIFRYIPKSAVAAHLKMKSDRLGRLIFKVEKFELKDVLFIGGLCWFSKSETLQLLAKSYEGQHTRIKQKF